MKLTLPICLLFVFTGCTTQSPPANQAESPAKAGSNKNSMDSPIVVSDGSTHLRHQGKSPRHDFDLGADGNGHVQASLQMPSTSLDLFCHSGNFTSCTNMTALAPLVAGWQVVILDAGGSPIVTIASADNVTVTSTFISALHVDEDSSGDTSGGTEFTHDNTFKSFTLTNGTGGTGNGTYTCNDTGKCKIKIRFK